MPSSNGASESSISVRINAIADILKSKVNIAVITHNAVDGDTLGSSVAVSRALIKLGKRITIIYEEEFPDHLSVLNIDKGICVYLPDDEGILTRTWDAVLVFDTADVKLLGKRARMLAQTDCVINIDHHFTNQLYGTYNIIDAKASATAELAYHLILALGVQLDREMALAIYTGICTDTGGFSYTNTNAASHEIAARTLCFDIDVAHLRFKFFDSITPVKLHCQGYVANELKLYENGKYAIVIIPAPVLDRLGANEEDCSGLVNIGRNIVGVEVSVFAREVSPGEFRVSLRSRGDYDVAAVARKFGGGGHKSAAGCTVKAGAPQIEAMLLAALNGGYIGD